MYHDPIHFPAFVELALLVIVLIVASVVRARRRKLRQRNRVDAGSSTG